MLHSSRLRFNPNFNANALDVPNVIPIEDQALAPEVYDQQNQDKRDYCFKNELLTPLSEFFKEYEKNPNIVEPLTEYLCVDFLARRFFNKKNSVEDNNGNQKRLEMECDKIAIAGGACESCRRQNDNVPVNYMFDISQRLPIVGYESKTERLSNPVFLKPVPSSTWAIAPVVGSLRTKNQLVNAFKALHHEHFAASLEALFFGEDTITATFRAKIVKTLKYVAIHQIDPDMQVYVDSATEGVDGKFYDLSHFCLYDVRYLAYYLKSTEKCSTNALTPIATRCIPAAITVRTHDLRKLLKENNVANKMRYNYSTVIKDEPEEGDNNQNVPIPFFMYVVNGPVTTAPPTEKVLNKTMNIIREKFSNVLGTYRVTYETERAAIVAIADQAYSELKPIPLETNGSGIFLDLKNYSPSTVVATIR